MKKFSDITEKVSEYDDDPHMSRDVVSNCIITDYLGICYDDVVHSSFDYMHQWIDFSPQFLQMTSTTHSGQTRERNGGDEDGKVSYTLLARKCIE